MKQEIPVLFETYYFELTLILFVFFVLNDIYNWSPPFKLDKELNSGELKYRNLKKLSAKICTVVLGVFVLFKYVVILSD